ncbi:LysR substrate-binding domain-containing protein [Fictibacillus macauensis]
MKQLRYFAAIAEEGQITRAAKRLNMAQPPLSQQLKSLEQELGVLLLERNGKNMDLTVPGKVLYKKAQSILQTMEETILEVREVGEGLKGELALGVVKTCFSYIPDRLRHFRTQYKDVTFRLHEGDSYRLAQLLQQREIEMALIRLPLDSLQDYASHELPPDHFVVVTNHSPSTVTSMPLSEVARMPLMLLHRISGVGLYELVLNECHKQGYTPHVVCQCADATMLLSLVRAGVGAALLPSSTLQAFPSQDLTVYELEDCQIQSRAALIWQKDRYLSKAAKKFMTLFENVVV